MLIEHEESLLAEVQKSVEESLLAEVQKSVVDNESLTSSSSSTAIVNNESPRHDLSFFGMHGTSKGGLMAGKVSSLCTIQKWF